MDVMTTTPATASPPAPTSSAVAVGPGGGRTVRFLQRWMVIVPILMAASGVLGVVGGFLLQDAARTTSESTAPSLIEVQDLFASVAEANAAATAAHLSVDAVGVEDRASRNLYLDARRRATEQLTVVSADLGRTGVDGSGGDGAESAAALQTISASLTEYGSAVEGARVANLNGVADADDRLRTALALVDAEIGPTVGTITTLANNRYDDEAARGDLLVALAVGLGLLTLIVLAWVQYGLAKRVRRIINPLLLLATLAFIGFLAVLINGYAVRQQALNDASAGGYDAVVASAQMQEATFGLQSQLGLLLLDSPGQGSRNVTVSELISDGETAVVATVEAADSDREQAAAEALAVRWGRYRDVAVDVTTLAEAGDQDAALAIFQGQGLSTFNGVNTAIESVLSDNRTQFTDGVALARSAVERLPWICLLLSVLAGILTIIGLQRRLGDYR